jgi:hypothetical protein
MKEEDKPWEPSQLAKRVHIVAFGTIDEVYVAQIRPKNLTLASIRRPAYIPVGTVPYLDWGFALSPAFRDQPYQVLAIAWGRTI